MLMEEFIANSFDLIKITIVMSFMLHFSYFLSVFNMYLMEFYQDCIVIVILWEYLFSFSFSCLFLCLCLCLLLLLLLLLLLSSTVLSITFFRKKQKDCKQTSVLTKGFLPEDLSHFCIKYAVVPLMLSD